jgi:hypothetical protein
MNIIEQTVEPKNGAIDLHILLPEGWDEWNIKAVVVYEKTDVLAHKPKIDLTKLVGKYSHLSEEDKSQMLTELDNLRNEWERDI